MEDLYYFVWVENEGGGWTHYGFFTYGMAQAVRHNHSVHGHRAYVEVQIV